MDHSDFREFFSTLSNLSRWAIVQMLRRRAATVSQIAECLGYEQSRVSHSLARLQRAGIVVCRWEDKRKMFHLVDDVSPLLHNIEAYLERRGTRASGAQAWPSEGWALAK